MLTGKNAAGVLFAVSLALNGVQQPLLASNSAAQLNTKDAAVTPSEGMVTIGHIPVNADQLVIISESSKVKISRSAAVSDIQVSANQPQDWNITGAVIKQAGMANKRSGVAVLADQLGSRAIVNGKIYPLPAGPIKGGISLNNKDGVLIGGQKVEPLQGCDMPGVSGDGPDSLEVVVPANYTGSLKIGAASDSKIELSSWNGGAVECYVIGTSSLSAGSLGSLSKAIVDINGKGTAEIKDLSAKVLVTNVNGSGKLSIAHGKADMSNATITGDGSITLKGNYKNLKQAVQGSGTISVSN